MKFQQLIKNYLTALENGSLEETTKLFEEDAIVVSPLYGKVFAKQFYKDLFDDTNASSITLLNTFPSNEDENTCAGHFRYDWTMRDGSLVSFECVDVFKISEEGKFKQLTIIYDTNVAKQAFDKLK